MVVAVAVVEEVIDDLLFVGILSDRWQLNPAGVGPAFSSCCGACAAAADDANG